VKLTSAIGERLTLTSRH